MQLKWARAAIPVYNRFSFFIQSLFMDDERIVASASTEFTAAAGAQKWTTLTGTSLRNGQSICQSWMQYVWREKRRLEMPTGSVEISRS